MPSTSLKDAEKTLAEGFVLGRLEYEDDHAGHSIIVTCTHRSVEEQQRLYAKGRTTPGKIVTNVDGVKRKSNHNYHPSRAIDFAVVIDGKVTWDEEEYDKAAPYFKKHGLAWGGDWKSFKDRPHVELPS